MTRRGPKPTLRKPARLNLLVESSVLNRLKRYASSSGTDLSKMARLVLVVGLDAMDAAAKKAEGMNR